MSQINVGYIFPFSFSLSVIGVESVMVWEWVGKEFPDMRQNEREIKFIRVGMLLVQRANSRENRR